MRRTLVTVLAAAALVASAAAGAGAQEIFDFYGLTFGMVPEEAARHVPNLEGTVSHDPGHGMTDLELVFDREDLLMEIRASWPRPEDPFAYQGMLRALRERFVSPVSARFPTVAVTLDEFSNRAAIGLVFLATDLREKNIDYHKNRFLRLLK